MRTSVRTSSDVRRRRAETAAVAVLAFLALAAGVASSREPRLGLLIVVIAVGLGAAAARPIVVAVLCLPACWAIQDVGLGSSLGVSDALLGGAAALAVPAIMRLEAGGLSVALRAAAAYLVLLVPSVLAAPTTPALTELVHRVLLVAAPLVVGAWLRMEGRLRGAVRLLMVVSCAIALLSLLEAVRTGFEPAYPLGYHKNYAGSLLALTLLLVLVLPPVVRSALRAPVILLLALGTAATQSRGAMLGGALGVLVWLFAAGRVQGRGRSTRVVALLVAIGFTAYTSYSVQQQLTADNRNTNSVGVRENVEAATRELWVESPLIGVGLRYYRTGDYPGYTASNSALNSELAEAGVVGMSGFVLLHVVVLAVLWRRRSDPWALAALALVAGNLLHGMFDIYWSSGITPLPFLVAGAALATPRAAR